MRGIKVVDVAVVVPDVQHNMWWHVYAVIGENLIGPDHLVERNGVRAERERVDRIQVSGNAEAPRCRDDIIDAG